MKLRCPNLLSSNAAKILSAAISALDFFKKDYNPFKIKNDYLIKITQNYFISIEDTITIFIHFMKNLNRSLFNVLITNILNNKFIYISLY